MCSCGVGCGKVDDDDAVDACGCDVRCCLCCGLSLWLLVTGVGVLLSPRGERYCLGVVVPSVPCVVVFPVTNGECCGVLWLLGIGVSVLLDGAYLDLDLSVDTGALFRIFGPPGGGGGLPGSVDIGVTILVEVERESVIVTSSSSIGTGMAGGAGGGLGSPCSPPR